jgi:uncharacterized membrane protein YbaN (DUF454 family)
MQRAQRVMKKALIQILAVFFLIIGLIGLALPFLQGFLFLAIGLILLSITSPRVREWSQRHTIKYPRFHKIEQKVVAWVTKVIGPIED